MSHYTETVRTIFWGDLGFFALGIACGWTLHALLYYRDKCKWWDAGFQCGVRKVTVMLGNEHNQS